MRILTLLLQCQLLIISVSALITLESIRNLTALADELRGRILDSGDLSASGGVERDFDPMIAALGGVERGQVVLNAGGEGDGDGEEVEVVVAAALRVLCSDLLADLEKPFIAHPASIAIQSETQDLKCRVIRRSYHHFLEATVRFLHVVQEKQMSWQWGHESPVFDNVGWLQSLWASRKANIQERSFIEQQMMLYGDTGCFGKEQEVLRRGVEVVEYLNDLLDSFP